LNREPTAALKILERIAQSFRPLAEKQEIILRIEVESGLPDLPMDPVRLTQVFGNLISNSLQYTQNSGEIVLFARGEEGSIILGLKDNGSGFNPEVLPFTFERYWGGDPSRKDGGSGLGLAIAKAFIELHGGNIFAANNSGKGIVVTIELPKIRVSNPQEEV
jgi:signal transduction histidine kinase